MKRMIRQKKILSGLFALILVIAFSGCNKFDTLPQLEIQVVDESGATISGAYAALFDSHEEWNKRINPVQAWRMTDPYGKVVFTDLKEITYYFYVRFDGKDNSAGEIFVSEPLKLNQKTIVIAHLR